MKCPRCKSDLIVVEYEDIELDYCQSCGGIWFDSGEMDLLASRFGGEQAALRPATDAREGRLRCPVCRVHMDKRYIGEAKPVLVDLCPSCDGLWLDAGELEELLSQSTEGLAGARNAVIAHLADTFGGGGERAARRSNNGG